MTLRSIILIEEKACRASHKPENEGQTLESHAKRLQRIQSRRGFAERNVVKLFEQDTIMAVHILYRLQNAVNIAVRKAKH